MPCYSLLPYLFRVGFNHTSCDLDWKYAKPTFRACNLVSLEKLVFARECPPQVAVRAQIGGLEPLRDTSP
jgi:hypothetical protein